MHVVAVQLCRLLGVEAVAEKVTICLLISSQAPSKDLSTIKLCVVGVVSMALVQLTNLEQLCRLQVLTLVAICVWISMTAKQLAKFSNSSLCTFTDLYKQLCRYEFNTLPVHYVKYL